MLSVIALLGFGTASLKAQAVDTDTLFRGFFERAVAYADAYPREKAYLHFDNGSYYVGDTIWFKAYVTLAESNRPSPLSKPLYVEMLNQTGQVVQRQIVELTDGEGSGQIALDGGTLSGYYEIRAYTRWMEAFSEPVYFSRTFPIYQKTTGEHLERHISTYDLNASMEQRPKGVEQRLALQFFPEGGALVRGVPSRVAFKAESRDEEAVSLKGVIRTRKGDVLTEIETLHDGMGVFDYTPGDEPAVAKVTYKGKEYTFDLPKPLPRGYVLKVSQPAGGIVCDVLCNEDTPARDLCAFISREGRPYDYWALRMKPGGKLTFLLKTKDLPGGVYQVSLLDQSGATLCERFTFVQPSEQLSLAIDGVKEVYLPYEPMRYEVELKDTDGNPLQGNFSISVQDALRSDYAEYDNTIFTDMLLTSGLKGYIHQPGYYFSDASLGRLQELDALLMVHGWRQYDMSLLTSANTPEPSQRPETDLVLNGQIRSTILKNELEDMEVSVMAKMGDTIIAGQTLTDGEGRFTLPVNAFEGEVEAVFQTRRKGAKRKKDTSVLLDRNFAPDTRTLGYEELHPEWMGKEGWMALAERVDSLYKDSIEKFSDTHVLDEVEVTAKRKHVNLTTQVFEQSVDAYYDVPRIVDELRDKGETVITIPDFLRKVNPNFIYEPLDGSCTYKHRTICLIVGEQVLDSMAAWVLWNEVDGIRQLMICEGANSYTEKVLSSARRVAKSSVTPTRTFDDSFYYYADAMKSKSKINRSSQMNYNINKNIDLSRFGEYALFYVIPNKGANSFLRLTQKSMRAARGTRRTFIQGYTRPLAFYSPAYKDKSPEAIGDDYRRTLYWNPSVRTDESGKAVVECYNGMYSNPVIIRAEVLADGVPCSVTVVSCDKEPK